MSAWQRIAAWTLLVLSAFGAVLPPLVLFLLKPTTLVHTTVHISGRLPLDAFFLLDASSSVQPRDWALALDFVQDMVLKLNASLPHFRAGLGQFAEHYKLESLVSQDIQSFETVAHQVQQMKGTTYVDRALCGDQRGPHGQDCPGGALADLASAPELGPEETTQCGKQQASQIILLVTDGLPTDGYAAMQSAHHLKERTNVTLMGVLVGSQPDHAHALYSLTSCCDLSDMELKEGQPECIVEPNWTCPHMVRSTSYADLVQSSNRLVRTLASDMECQVTREEWNTSTDLRSLWFLLLPVPMLLYLCWLRLLVLLCRVKEPDDSDSSESDSESTVSSALEEHHVPSAGAGPQQVDEVGGGGSNTLGGNPGLRVAPGAGGGYVGKRWAPVRTAYIVGGQRLDVDYGGMAPPMAPNAARRGYEQESIRDTPEKYFANLDQKLLTRTLVDTLVESAGGNIVSAHPLCNFGLILPLVCTLALLPLVVLCSGILNLLKWPGA